MLILCLFSLHETIQKSARCACVVLLSCFLFTLLVKNIMKKKKKKKKKNKKNKQKTNKQNNNNNNNNKKQHHKRIIFPNILEEKSYSWSSIPFQFISLCNLYSNILVQSEQLLRCTPPTFLHLPSAQSLWSFCFVYLRPRKLRLHVDWSMDVVSFLCAVTLLSSLGYLMRLPDKEGCRPKQDMAHSYFSIQGHLIQSIRTWLRNWES